MLDCPPYFPDLAPCDFFLSPKLKRILKGTCFKGVDNIKANLMAYHKSIKKEEFAQCFKAWSRRMAKYIEVNGKYFEGDNLRSHKSCMCYLKWTWYDMCLNNVAVLMINMAQFKTYMCHSVVSLRKTLHGTFPCLVVLASSSKFQSYLY